MKNKNITLSLDSDLIDSVRHYVRVKGISVNQMVRDFLVNTVRGSGSAFDAKDFLNALDAATVMGKGRQWKREDAYTRESLS